MAISQGEAGAAAGAGGALTAMSAAEAEDAAKPARPAAKINGKAYLFISLPLRPLPARALRDPAQPHGSITKPRNRGEQRKISKISDCQQDQFYGNCRLFMGLL
jgi:hypothetical protein